MNKEIFIIYKIPSVPTGAYENWNDSPYAIKYVSEHTSLKEAKTVLKNKNRSTINLMLADQSPHKSKVDYYCTFLNQDTPVYLGPDKLVNAANLEFLFVEVNRLKRGYYQMKIVPLKDKSIEENKSMTLLHVNHLEKIINHQPENWLWSHKRWKNSRKK